MTKDQEYNPAITIPDIKTSNGSEYRVTRIMTLRDYLMVLNHDTIGSVNFRKFMRRLNDI